MATTSKKKPIRKFTPRATIPRKPVAAKKVEADSKQEQTDGRKDAFFGCGWRGW